MTNYLTETKINLYKYVDVQLRLNEKLVGGIPKTEKLIEGWLNAKTKDRGPIPDQIEQTKRDMGLVVDSQQKALENELELVELEERAWTGFKRDENGLYIEARQLKALLKESGNVAGVTTTFLGAKNYITNGIFVTTPRIYLGTSEPSGFEETVCHIKGAQGTRSAIKRFDYVLNPTLTFQLALLQRIQGGSKAQIIPTEIVYALFVHGQNSGLGANRSQGYGTFTILKFEDSPVQEGTPSAWEGLVPKKEKAAPARGKRGKKDEPEGEEAAEG